MEVEETELVVERFAEVQWRRVPGHLSGAGPAELEAAAEAACPPYCYKGANGVVQMNFRGFRERCKVVFARIACNESRVKLKEGEMAAK